MAREGVREAVLEEAAAACRALKGKLIPGAFNGEEDIADAACGDCAAACESLKSTAGKAPAG
jgi:hypothetical protein